MDTLEIYEEATAIAAVLENKGFGTAAENIRTAISNGTSGTQIYMSLRFYLAPLLNAFVLDSDIKRRIRTLHDALDHALK